MRTIPMVSADSLTLGVGRHFVWQMLFFSLSVYLTYENHPNCERWLAHLGRHFVWQILFNSFWVPDRWGPSQLWALTRSSWRPSCWANTIYLFLCSWQTRTIPIVSAGSLTFGAILFGKYGYCLSLSVYLTEEKHPNCERCLAHLGGHFVWQILFISFSVLDRWEPSHLWALTRSLLAPFCWTNTGTVYLFLCTWQMRTIPIVSADSLILAAILLGRNPRTLELPTSIMYPWSRK
jgi:hypothetical protein